jgi:hypothetical protein
MIERMKFKKVAQALIRQLADQMMKTMQSGHMTDPYYSLETQLVEAQRFAYEEGKLAGKQEALQAMDQFEDTEKDSIGS